ncbi:hypothetical protein RHGRI_026709 [Rhododendron griersonianum]|uniref:Uncharacterized protein n=1 Tax=Rhododendron griersonianum TaxID=479676 RepID=A0AAV6IYR9_9ERIC|nr:hypothetical protein RHGRI_026709 [Rhododendron griersonianum]
MSESLLQAKTLNVAQVFLPSDVKDEIDKLNEDLNTAGCSRYAEPENKSKFWKNTESLQCNTMTCIYAFSLSCWSLFVVSGWLLVAVTFILCGGFASTQEKVVLMCFSAISNTCMAMGEWVDTSQAETTLSNILPRVDQRTANQTLTQSKQVVNDIVNIVNQFIYTIADTNLSSQANNPSYCSSRRCSKPSMIMSKATAIILGLLCLTEPALALELVCSC